MRIYIWTLNEVSHEFSGHGIMAAQQIWRNSFKTNMLYKELIIHGGKEMKPKIGKYPIEVFGHLYTDKSAETQKD